MAEGWMTLIAWGLLVAIVNLLPISGYRSAPFVADLPVLATAAFVLTPPEVALISFLGAFDTRELRRSVPLLTAIWNRSQNSCSWFVGSCLIASLPTSGSKGIDVLLFPLLGLLANALVNYVLVALSIVLMFGAKVRQTLLLMRIGVASDYVLTFASSAAIASMAAASYALMHAWTLPLLLAPVLLARQALVRSQMFLDRDRDYRSRERAIREITHQIDRERKEERHLLAADIHDELLQPLFKVTLLTQVIKHDLKSGRLLNLDRDVEELNEAVGIASGACRAIVGDLRRSGLGQAGLARALVRLVDVTREGSSAAFDTDIDEVEASSHAQLTLYQIAKEALSNAVRHSRASTVSVELRSEAGWIHLRIHDDGRGFDPFEERHGHFGILIMKERAAALGGSFFVDSYPNGGCTVTASVPAEVDV